MKPVPRSIYRRLCSFISDEYSSTLQSPLKPRIRSLILTLFCISTRLRRLFVGLNYPATRNCLRRLYSRSSRFSGCELKEFFECQSSRDQDRWDAKSFVGGVNVFRFRTGSKEIRRQVTIRLIRYKGIQDNTGIRSCLPDLFVRFRFLLRSSYFLNLHFSFGVFLSFSIYVNMIWYSLKILHFIY